MNLKDRILLSILVNLAENKNGSYISLHEPVWIVWQAGGWVRVSTPEDHLGSDPNFVCV